MKKTSRRKLAAAGIAGAVALGGFGVYATSITLTAAGGFSAGTIAAQAGCDTDGVTVTPAAPVWSDANDQYEIQSVTVSSINSPTCDGQAVYLTALNSSTDSLGSGTSDVINDVSEAIALTGVDAEAIANWAVVIR